MTGSCLRTAPCASRSRRRRASSRPCARRRRTSGSRASSSTCAATGARYASSGTVGLLVLALLALLFAMAAPGAQAPPCFGAAARDPESTCVNDALRPTVAPRPRGRGRCPTARAGRSAVSCTVGLPVRGPEGAVTFALVGDSHAGHWRAAFEHVAHARELERDLDHPLELPAPEGGARPARAAAHAMPAHGSATCSPGSPRIRRSAPCSSPGSPAAPAWCRRRASAASDRGARLLDAWAGAAADGPHIVVLRDTPKFTRRHRRVRHRALARREAAGTRAPSPRSSALWTATRPSSRRAAAPRRADASTSRRSSATRAATRSSAARSWCATPTT